MPKNGVFIVRFQTNDDNEKAIAVGTKPLIVKRQNPKMDLNAEDVKSGAYLGSSSKVTSEVLGTKYSQ